MKGMRKCSKCSRLFKIDNAGPELAIGGPVHVCPNCEEPEERDIGPCGRCNGQGVTYDLTRLPVKCPGCKGTGRLTTTIPEHNPWID